MQRNPELATSYKLEGFSVARLMTRLTALDRDVEIVIRQKPRSRAAARISVAARNGIFSDSRRAVSDLSLAF